jgi:glycosyltransferase involved in cell wall biosynthesis
MNLAQPLPFRFDLATLPPEAEAMRAELPIITTQTDGPLFVLAKNPNVIWAAPDDSASLQAALTRLFTQPLAVKPVHYPELEQYQLETIYPTIMAQYERSAS